MELCRFFFIVQRSLTDFICLIGIYFGRDEILTRPIFGNRVQQPHLQNAQKSSDDDDSKDLRPEDLLSVEEDMDDESDMDDSIIPKEEPIDIDDMDDIAGDDDPIDE